MPCRLVGSEVAGALHPLLQPQFYLLIVGAVGLTTEDESHGQFAFARMRRAEIEQQLVLIGDQLALERKQSGAQAARLQFFGDGVGLVQYHGELAGGDGF